jgi:two-component system, chemotaxis family, response regulator Rcp1
VARDVLLIEDNPGDARLAQEAFRAAYGCIIQLHVVSDGVEAMAFLRREGAHRGAPTPDLILLDLNLPKISGYEVLAQVKRDDSLKMIPVVVLSSSEAAADVVKSYRLHANCYFKKPAEWDAFYTIVRAIKDFWLSAVDLPSNV